MADFYPSRRPDTSAPAHAQPAPFLGIHAINVFVRDQDESLRFYLDQLGFDLAFDARLQSGDRWVAVAPPDGTAVLALVAPGLDSREYNLIGRSTGVVFVTENVIAKYEEWSRRGVRFLFAPRLRRFQYDRRKPALGPGSESPEMRTPVWGGVFTRFRDIDGNTFGLVGFDEVNREIEAQRRRIAEKQEAERRAAQEWEIARQVQARLFPQTLPLVATVEYTGTCIQARQVGGDYYDFLDLGRGRFAFVIGDISGKGIAAALLMANLQANLRSQSAIALEEPQHLLRSVNRLFFENTSESSYATLLFAQYDENTRRLLYANCGHLPALLLRREGALERLHSTATVLGLFSQWECSIAECELHPGDMLALYTDGITESFNTAGQEFGEQRLIEALYRYRDLPAAAVVCSIVDEIRRFSPEEQHDDITLIVAKMR
jgi:serine phosphatase RsbU (regulator of sigma subunit)/catechol 2,3-dioxygenase-like lactoylglutathione lyase family enzyme